MRTTSGLARGVSGPPLSSPVSPSPALWVSGACERVAEENTLRSAVEVTLVSARERRDPSLRREDASSRLGSNENLEPVTTSETSTIIKTCPQKLIVYVFITTINSFFLHYPLSAFNDINHQISFYYLIAWNYK